MASSVATNRYIDIATGTEAINTTIAPGRAFALESVSVHLNGAGGAGNLTVTVDAAAGAAYDVVLKTIDMTSITDWVWQPERPIELASGDKVVIAWANAGTKTYGLTVRWSGR